jgi:hypothetical protein
MRLSHASLSDIQTSHEENNCAVASILLPAQTRMEARPKIFGRNISLFRGLLARPERFELPTPRFVVWCRRIETGAQLVVTSYDRRFAGAVARVPGDATVEHLAVHPATVNQPVIRTTPHETEIRARKALYDEDRNAEEPARSFTDGCRVFLEAVLGDVFDDPAHSAWVKENTNPTLAAFVSRLRPYISAGPAGMFAMPVFKDFIAHRALVDNSPVLTLMNKAHHVFRGLCR